MQHDLGTWRPHQAATIVRVLRGAGIDAETERGDDVVRVTVSAEDAEAAQDALADAMDEIARAAREPSGPSPQRRAPRPEPDEEATGRPLLFERLRNLAPLAVVLAAALFAVSVVGGALRIVVFVAAVVVIGVLMSRRGEDGD